MGKRGPEKSTADFKKHIGNIEITKGQTKDGIPVVAWDAIQQCDEDQCPIATLCPYEKAGKCRVRKEYIGYVQRILLGQVKADNQIARFRIGMELVPLFLQLVSLKIYAHGATVTYFDDKGNIKLNPIHRELRSCIKSISDTIKSVSEAFEGGGPKGTDSLLGDSDYYENLFAGEPEEENFKMRNRV